jgi:hypothetical protein
LKVILEEAVAYDAGNENQVMVYSVGSRNPIKGRLDWLVVLTVFYIVCHHYANELFHRRLIKVWESMIMEDFQEEFTQK